MSNATYELTPGDRRELRSLIKKQFDVLRKDVKRRESELKSEIETELLNRYRAQDEHVQQAQREVDKATEDYRLELQRITDALRSIEPDMSARVQGGLLYSSDSTRSQLHTALLASVPTRIADALTDLDQQEINLLRELTVGALATDEANSFLGRVPTVGQLVPRARLDAIGQAIDGGAA